MKKPLSILLVWMFLYSHGMLAQRYKADSLQRMLDGQSWNVADTLYLQLLVARAKAYYRIHADSCEQLAVAAKAACQTAGYQRGIVDALRAEGLAYRRRMDNEAAMARYLEALNLAMEIGHQTAVGQLYNSMGNVYYSQFNFPKALDYYGRSLGIAEANQSEQGIAMALNNMALVYGAQGRYGEALQAHRKVLAFKMASGDYVDIGNSYGNLAVIFGNLQDTTGAPAQQKAWNDSAIYYEQLALEMYELGGYTEGVCTSLLGMANNSLRQGRHEEALSYYQRAQGLMTENTNTEDSAVLALGLGEALVGMGRSEEGKLEVEKAAAMARRIGQKQLLRTTSQTLAGVYKQMGRHAEALAHYERFMAYTDTLRRADEERKSMERAIVEKAAKAEQLRWEQQEQALRHAQEKRQQYAVMALLAFGLVSTIGMAYVFMRARNKEKQTRQIIAKQAADLQQAYDKLKALELFKEDMMGMLVHDLKNPLSVILYHTEQLPSEQRLAKIRQAAQQMLQLSLNLLDVQQFEHAGVALRLQPVDLRQIFQKAVEQVAWLARQKEQQLLWPAHMAYSVESDPELLERVLVNLLTNSIKYTPRKGKIALEAVPNGKGQLACMVQDEGAGIPLAQIDLVFGRFSQGNAKPSGKIKSTGLGLAFCKMVAEAHAQGYISISSELGKGTKVIFGLPLLDTAGNELSAAAGA